MTKPKKAPDDLCMPADEFDRIMRNAFQVAPPEPEKPKPAKKAKRKAAKK